MKLKMHWSQWVMLGLLPASLATAQVGAHVRGAGEVVDINGQYVLRGTVDRTLFDCHSGDEVLTENPYLVKLLSKISTLDWYFAGELKHELRSLNYCYTGPLYPIHFYEHTWPVMPNYTPSIFVAYRLNNRVLIDEQKFHSSRMSEQTRALLLIHEVLLSYIPNFTEFRSSKIFAMDQAFLNVDNGSLASRTQLHRKMKENSVYFPTETSGLDPYRAQIEFATSNDEAARKAIILASLKPEQLTTATLPDEVKLTLALTLTPWDRAAVLNSLKCVLLPDLEHILSEGTLTEFVTILNKSYELLDPGELAFSLVTRLSQDKLNWFTQSSLYQDSFTKIYGRMANAGVSYSEFRIRASEELIRALGLYPNGSALTGLSPSLANGELPVGARALAEQLIWLAKTKQWPLLEQSISENARFYSAFGLQSQKATISQMTISIAREKPLALTVLGDLRDSLLNRMMAYVESRLDHATFTELKTKIHFNQF